MSISSSSVNSFPQRRLNSRTPIRSILEQVKSDSSSQISSVTSVEDLPRISIGEKSYILSAYLRTKRSRSRHSWVWKYGTSLTEMPSKTVYWSCNRCDEALKPQLYDAQTSSNAARHLEGVHGLRNPTNADESASDDDRLDAQGRIDVMFNQHRKRQKPTRSPVPNSLWERFKAALIAWMISYQIAFIAVENSFFKDLIAIISPALADMMPTGNTIRTWIMTEYDIHKARLKARLQEDSLGQIHLSFDLWTSPNAMAMMAVVAHYTDRQYQVQTRLLALRRLHGDHSGENQAELLVEIITDFEIADKIGYFVADNASNNDTAVEIVIHTLFPSLPPAQRQQRRLRCWGHILNLAAKAFLFGKDGENFDEEILINRMLVREQAELQAWRKKGPIGKLHNVVVFIRRSPQRQETFSELAEAGDKHADLALLQDNATRWNSAYLMIDRALKKRANVDKFIDNAIYEMQKSKTLSREDKLADEDWRVLEETHRILEPFYKQTKRLQSRAKDGTRGAVWEAYPSCEYLLRHILSLRDEYQDVEPYLEAADRQSEVFSSRKHIKTSIENCWGKLDDYYKLLDTLPVYMAALVLNPGQKLAFIERHWARQRTWIDTSKKGVKKLWEAGWKGRHSAVMPIAFPTPEDSSYVNIPRRAREPDDFDTFMNPPDLYTTQQTGQVDEYKKYLEIPAQPCEKPLMWWKGRQTEWPSLTAMACDVLSIPLMSSECERVFSSAGYAITSRRNHMKEDIIEATTCLRAWRNYT
jgi:hypothetical protein